MRHLRGEPVSNFAGTVGIEQFTDHTQPHSPGLADRVTIQDEQIDAFRAHHPRPEQARVSQGLVVIPTDSTTGAGLDARDFCMRVVMRVD